MAARLHALAPEGASVGGRTYLEWAEATWRWFDDVRLINAKNLINDGLVSSGPDPSCANNGQQEWTYNQGVVLGGLGDLYKVTRNLTLLDVGVSVATAAAKTLVWNETSLLKESCDAPDDNGCDLDQEQFKGIFVRYLMYFTQVLEGDTMGAYAGSVAWFKEWIASNANAIWGLDRNTTDLSELWTGPFDAARGGAGAIMQASAADALLAQEVLNGEAAPAGP